MFDLDIHLVGGGFKDSVILCYFYHRKLGEMIQWRIDHQVVWNDTWTYLEFWVLHCVCVFFAIWHYTTHFFCVTFRVKLESPNYDLQKVPVDDGLGFEDQLSDSGLVSFSTQEVQRSLPMSPGKSKSFFKGNSRRHTVYYMLNTVFFSKSILDTEGFSSSHNLLNHFVTIFQLEWVFSPQKPHHLAVAVHFRAGW